MRYEVANDVIIFADGLSLSVALPTPTYTSNFNATVNAQCSSVMNPRVVVYIDEVIINSSLVPLPYCWGAQLNCWAPPGETTSFHQYAPLIYGGWFSTAIDYFKSNDGLLFAGDFDGATAPGSPPNFGVGWRIEETVNTDVSGHVVSATVIVYDAAGGVWHSATSSPALMVVGWLPDWSALISCFSVEFGSAGSVGSIYTSGKGRIAYIPGAGQRFTVDQPVSTLACVQRAAQHTAETSNMKYSEMIPQADGTLLQYYAWDGNFLVSGPPPPVSTVLTLTPRSV